ncbi:hypothetical protein HOLleu_11730 [Holothuria leucospilota]|uniref:Uncharacterized protein n=1 Tax=Holothuria leucospilota TaxID=206669 RepID=A0A9Q1CGY6_HOLLE|nr:hypothetical protein HOLleu_11730 [Holothuria leucospilota]
MYRTINEGLPARFTLFLEVNLSSLKSMKFVNLFGPFKRFHVLILLFSSFVVSLEGQCMDHGIRNTAADDEDDDNSGGGDDGDVDDDDEDAHRNWQLYNFNGSCQICFLRNGRPHDAELILPCVDQNQQIVDTINISYAFQRHGTGRSSLSGEPLTYYNLSNDIECGMNTSPGTQLKTVEMNPFTDSRNAHVHGHIEIKRQRENSYRLKVSNSVQVSVVCLKEVELLSAVTSARPTPSPTTASTRVTTGSMPIGTGISTAALTNIGIVTIKTHEVGLADHTTTTTSGRSSSQGNQRTAIEQGQSYFPIWVIFVIIAIVIISICAVAGVFIRRRKRHDHQPANNVNTGRVNDESNGIKGIMKNDKDVIPNPTYGQEHFNEKEEEYHSYTDIDVKVPANSEMIYNSAYESPPASSDMLYNSAYESEEANNDMVYNSVYESKETKSDMIYNSAYESSTSN